MRIVYMGTPEFAVPPLKRLIEEGFIIEAVFTQPDKPKGRSGKLVPPPVKVLAEESGIKVYQPEKLRDPENVSLLSSINPDMIIVAAYGQILPESILNIPKYGCINIHASLLPKYRGAAPIERCILDGEKVTGVTTMYMAKGLDTGDIISSMETEIRDDDTGETLRERLSFMGADLIISTVKSLEDGTAVRTPQDDSESNYAKMLDKEMGNVDFTKSAEEIERMIRGLNPWPTAYTFIKGKNIKLYKADVISPEDTGKLMDGIFSNLSEENNTVGDSGTAHVMEDILPGTVIEVTRKFFTVLCGSGALRIRRLQPEGKKEMDTASYLNGNKLEVFTRCQSER